MVAWLPLFLRMPPWVDNTWYDLCARSVLRGEVVYREIFWHGLPGMIWLQTAVRAAFGWSSEALRAVDAAVVGATVWILAAYALPVETTRAGRVWTALLLVLFYSGTSEWCHCQPDTWMLLPALVALLLRQRQVRRVAGGGRPDLWLSFAEGACWGLAFVVKPFVAVPAVCAWLAGGALVVRARPRWRAVAADSAALLAGGFAVGALTVAWLFQTGNWPFFRESALGVYGREYFQRSPGFKLRLEKMLEWMWPWSLLQLLAVPVAVAGLCGSVASRSAQTRDQARTGAPTPLLAAFFLGWFVQANFLQQHYMYHVVPVLLLAIAVLAADAWARTGLVCLFSLWALIQHPLLDRDHLALWRRCWYEGSTPALRDALTLQADNPTAPDWQELAKIRRFLDTLDLHDRELTCYATSSVHLYEDMGLRPSTRYPLAWALMQLLNSHATEIAKALYASPQRYVVNDLRQLGITRQGAADKWPDRPFGIPPVPERALRWFPWTEPVVFRAGRYLVHEVRPPLRLQAPEAGPPQ